MTVKELIEELNKIKNKDFEMIFCINQKIINQHPLLSNDKNTSSSVVNYIREDREDVIISLRGNNIIKKERE